jgi:hypothetical protein
MSRPALRFHDRSPLPQLAPNLVIGHIRWNRSLGLPEGKMSEAFSLVCYHYQMIPIHGGSALGETPTKSFHIVDAWEGPNDAETYRVSFFTDAQTPRGYRPDDPNPLQYQNFLEVSFRPAMIWKNPPQTISGVKFLAPLQIIFGLPGQPQLLPDINVLKMRQIHYR